LTPCCNPNDRWKRIISLPQEYGYEYATFETGKTRCEEAGYEVCSSIFRGFHRTYWNQYNRRYY